MAGSPPKGTSPGSPRGRPLRRWRTSTNNTDWRPGAGKEQRLPALVITVKSNRRPDLERLEDAAMDAVHAAIGREQAAGRIGDEAVEVSYELDEDA
jgi:hypothetical protein